VIIRLRGLLADLLVEIDPEMYAAYVTKDKKGHILLLCRCLNAIYGTVIAGLLYYRKFKKTVEGNDFTLNPYDPCVANRVVEHKRQTVCWHVDDCKLSHVDPKINNHFIDTLREEYENIFQDGTGKMTVHCAPGKHLKYLRMDLDFSTDGVCKITMPEYIKKLLKTWESVAPKEKGTKDCAAPKDLFAVDDKLKKLATTEISQHCGEDPICHEARQT
jgi:hypothetical protein